MPPKVYFRDDLLAIRDAMRNFGSKANPAASSIPKHLFVVSNTNSSQDGPSGDMTREGLFGAAGGRPRRAVQQQQQQQHAPSSGSGINTGDSREKLGSPALTAAAAAHAALWVYRLKGEQLGGAKPVTLSNALTLTAIKNLVVDGLLEEDEVELRRADGGSFMSFKAASAAGEAPAPGSSSAPAGLQSLALAAAAAPPPPSNVWRRHTNSAGATVGSAAPSPMASSGHVASSTGSASSASGHHAHPGHHSSSTRPPRQADHAYGFGARVAPALPSKEGKTLSISRDDMPSAEELSGGPGAMGASGSGHGELLPPPPASSTDSHPGSAGSAGTPSHVPPVYRDAAALPSLGVPGDGVMHPIPGVLHPIASIDGLDDNLPPPPVAAAPVAPAQVPAPQQQQQQSSVPRRRQGAVPAMPAPLDSPPPAHQALSPSAPAGGGASVWGKVEAPPTVDISQLLIEEKIKQKEAVVSSPMGGPHSWGQRGGGDQGEKSPGKGYANSFPSLDDLASSTSTTKSPMASSGSVRSGTQQQAAGRPASGSGKTVPQHQQTTSRKGKNVAQQFFH